MIKTMNLMKNISLRYQNEQQEEMQMEQKILAFMKENGIAVFAEADRTTGAVHIEKLGTWKVGTCSSSWCCTLMWRPFVTIPVATSLSRSGDREIPDVCSPGWMMAGLPCCFSTVSCRDRRSRSGSGSWTRRCARFIHE